MHVLLVRSTLMDHPPKMTMVETLLLHLVTMKPKEEAQKKDQELPRRFRRLLHAFACQNC